MLIYCVVDIDKTCLLISQVSWLLIITKGQLADPYRHASVRTNTWAMTWLKADTTRIIIV